MMTQYTLSLSYDDAYNMEEYEGEIKPGLILRLTFNRILTYHLTQVITSPPLACPRFAWKRPILEVFTDFSVILGHKTRARCLGDAHRVQAGSCKVLAMHREVYAGASIV